MEEFGYLEIRFKNTNGKLDNVEEFISNFELPIYTYSVLSSLKQNVSSIIILLLVEKFANTDKAISLKFGLYNKFIEYLEEKYCEIPEWYEISVRQKDPYYNFEKISEATVYDFNYILNKDLFDLVRKNKKTIEYSKEKINYKNIDKVFDVRHKLYKIRRKRKISKNEIEQYVLMYSNKINQHLSNSERNYIVEQLFDFFENKWFLNEKERKHYWYMKSKETKTSMTKEDRIKKGVKAKMKKMLIKITVALKSLNPFLLNRLSLQQIADLIGVNIKTFKKYLKSHNLLVKIVKKILIVVYRKLNNKIIPLSNNFVIENNIKIPI